MNKHAVKKAIGIIGAILLVIPLMAGCGSGSSSQSEKSGTTTLDVATDTSFVPFEFKS